MAYLGHRFEVSLTPLIRSELGCSGQIIVSELDLPGSVHEKTILKFELLPSGEVVGVEPPDDLNGDPVTINGGRPERLYLIAWLARMAVAHKTN